MTNSAADNFQPLDDSAIGDLRFRSRDMSPRPPGAAGQPSPNELQRAIVDEKREILIRVRPVSRNAIRIDVHAANSNLVRRSRRNRTWWNEHRLGA